MPGIYLHIPFCKQACHYCDFHFSTSLNRKNDFVKALVKEIELRKDYLESHAIINTIYFGGGTPSLLEAKELDEILNQLHKYFTIAADAEITLEANPDDLTRSKLKVLDRSSINRLSIGIQSFDDAELKWMNRSHTASMAIDCIKEAQSKGFENISADLIYGSPLLSNESWIQNLEKIFASNINHLSCYNLTVESRTVLAAMIKKGKTTGPDDAKSAEQFKILMDLTRSHGFEHYEISNFCRDQHYSMHNSNYWKGIHYLGLGPSAHSYNGISRQWNISNNAVYIKETESGNLSFTKEDLQLHEMYNEYIMTGLRTKWGVHLKSVEERFGGDLATYFSNTVKRYLADASIEENNSAYFITPAGKFFTDRIASDLFFVPEVENKNRFSEIP